MAATLQTLIEPAQASVQDTEPGPELGPRGNHTSMGRYHVLRVIGEGGMGTVYEAYDPKLERKVAIKVLQASVSKAGGRAHQIEQRLRLMREAKSLASVSHPNIVAIFDVGLLEDNEEVFLAMEFVIGQSLRAYWGKRRPSWREAIDILCQAGEGLAAAHAAGIVHRDFKPENVLVGDDGVVRVLDFGLARRDDLNRPAGSGSANSSSRMSQEDFNPGDLTSHKTVPPAPGKDNNSGVATSTWADVSATESITRDGTLMGTPRYMAPEQLRGATSGPMGDVFAFCTVLYEALCGVAPFPGDTPGRRLSLMKKGQIAWPQKVPTWLRRLVEQGLRYDPQARGTGIADLTHALRQGARREQALSWIAPTAVATGVAAIAIGFAGFALAPNEGNSCAGAGRGLDGVWSNERKNQLAKIFDEVGLRQGEAIWDRTRAAVEGWRETWNAHQIELCEQAEQAQRTKDQRKLADIEISRACLADGQAQLEALLSVWRTPTLNQVLNAPGAIQALSIPTSCMDSQAVRSKAPLPRDPDLRGQVLALRRSLGAVRVYTEQAHFDLAERELGRIEPIIHQVGDLASFSEYFEARANLLGSQRFHMASDQLLETALAFARAAGHWQMAARTATQIALTRFYMMSQQSGRDEGTRQAQTMVLAAGSPPTLTWQLTTYEAVNLCMLGDQTAGGAKFAEALPLAIEGFGERSTETARTLFMLGVNASYRGLHRAAIDHYNGSLQTNTMLYGPTHPEAIAAHSFLAQESVFIGDLANAQWHAATGSRKCIDAGYSVDLCTEVFESAGHTAKAIGNLSEAQEILMQAIEARKIRGVRTFPGHVWPHSLLAVVMSARGDHEAAAALNSQGFTLLRQEPTLDKDAWTLTYIIDGEIAFTRGDLPRARFAVDLAASSLLEPSELGHILLPRLEHLEGQLLLATRDLEGALAKFESALAREQSNNGAPNVVSRYQDSLAQTLLELHANQAAHDTAEAAFTLARAQDGVHPRILAPFRVTLARTSMALGIPERAIEELDTAIADFDPIETVIDPRPKWRKWRLEALNLMNSH